MKHHSQCRAGRRTCNVNGDEKLENGLRVGVIASTHGLKGEVKVYPTTDDARKFKDLSHLTLDTGKEQITLEVQQVRFFKKMVILKFKGIDHINDIEKYKGKSLWISREDVAELKENEFYVIDLIGLTVHTDDGKKGILKDVIETGANDVYVVDFEDLGEVLIPAIKDCILNVDMETKEMKIHLIDGLL